jgi:hypothetical protein
VRRSVLRPLLAWGSLAPPDVHEIARFLREQPPLTTPPRTATGRAPGFIAWSLNGYRIIRHGQD